MKFLLPLMIIAFACFGLSSTAFAEDGAKEKHILNVGTIAPPGTPWSNQLEALQKRIEKESNGRIEMRLFLGTAGGENSIVRQTRRGELQAAAVSVG
ncbi:MAG: hypothetical protein ACNA8W_15050, partial [Bradymonadaceae bacterium]